MLACEGSRNFILNYPDKNITKYLTIETRGYCDNIYYNVYNNNDIKPELIYNITQRYYNVQYLNLTFIDILTFKRCFDYTDIKMKCLYLFKN